MAEEDWCKGFFKRHPDLSLRTPEESSGACAMGFNRVAVSNFFNLLNEILDKHELDTTKIFNCDETGISVVPKQFSKIIAVRGQRQVGVLSSAERGTTVTAEICCSAAGCYMPPMLIFPRKKKQREFEASLPPGGWAEVSVSGWITAEIFVKWLQQFILFSKTTKEHPVLLLLDGHTSHTKNLAAIDLARDNGVLMLCFPPHCSHKIQPLGVAFMKPLSLY
ncbi:uncharacterized protein [Diabrotica undecimpunctata]|uniref:uncharacterized protein n=1 Tax=Diabrotica undecimpunctata TaxID=50387 RepID=UPI003B632F97